MSSLSHLSNALISSYTSLFSPHSQTTQRLYQKIQTFIVGYCTYFKKNEPNIKKTRHVIHLSFPTSETLVSQLAQTDKLLAKQKFNTQDFIALSRIYSNSLVIIAKEKVIDKFYEQINLLSTSKQVLEMALLCGDLASQRSLHLLECTKRLVYPLYYKRMLELDFEIFESTFADNSEAKLSPDLRGNVSFGLSCPEKIPKNQFIAILGEYLEWLYQDSQDFYPEFTALHDHFKARQPLRDAIKTLKNFIETRANALDLIELAEQGRIFPSPIKSILADRLLVYALKLPQEVQLIKSAIEKLEDLTANLSAFSNAEIIDLAPFLGRAKHLIFKEINSNTLNQFIKAGSTYQFINLTELTFNDCAKLDDWACEIIAEKFLNLSSIHLYTCDNITDSGLNILAKQCLKLTEIDFGSLINITNQSLKSFAKFNHHLTKVTLRYCDGLTNEGIKELFKASSKLSKVQLSAKILDSAIEYLSAYCPLLTHITLNSCYEITDKIFVSLATCSHLKMLNLSSCFGIQGRELKMFLKQCHELEELCLSHLKEIKDQDIELLSRSNSRLTVIDLSYNSNLTDESLKHLASIPSLKWIGLQNCEQITDQGIGRLAQGVPNLNRIILNFCSSLTDKSIELLVNHCPKLTLISFLGLKNFTDITGEALARHGSCLNDLCLSGVRPISKSSIQMIARNCRLLTHVNLSSQMQVDDKTVKVFATYCSFLQHINLERNQSITDHAIEALAYNSLYLQVIYLRGCSRVTDKAIAALVKNCTELKEVWLDNNAHMTDKTLGLLAENSVNLEIVDLDLNPRITWKGIEKLANAYKNLKKQLCVTSKAAVLRDKEVQFRSKYPKVIL